MHFPESLRMKSEFISCDFISPNPCGWKSEFQIQFRNIASSFHSTEFSLLLLVCVINSGSSPDHLSILRKFSRANPSFSGIFRGWGDQLWTFSDFAEYSREESSILRTFRWGGVDICNSPGNYPEFFQGNCIALSLSKREVRAVSVEERCISLFIFS